MGEVRGHSAVTRYGKPVALLLLLAAVALGLAAASSVFQPAPPDGQVVNTSVVTVSTDQTNAFEGGPATFTLTRFGGNLNGELTVSAKTWEPNVEDSLGNNSTEQNHEVTFKPGSNSPTLRVTVVTNQTVETGTQTLNAQVQEAANGEYQVGSPDTAIVTITDVNGAIPGVATIDISTPRHFPPEEIRGNVNVLFTRSGGDTTQPLTVYIEVIDSAGALRGNHWDPPSEHPTQVEFAANSTSTRLSVALPDDQWDIASLPITVRLLPSNDYVGADIGFFTFVLVRLQDNYTAHELELNFGKDSANDADEGAPLKFIVKSRQQDTDTGQTATFTVRVETSRSGADYRLDGCEEGPKNGPYKNLPLEITGSALEVEEVLEMTENGVQGVNWRCWAEILPLRDHQGNNLSAYEEAQYRTVKPNFRRTRIAASDTGDLTGTVTIEADQTTVIEGGEARVFTLTRTGGAISAAATVRVPTSEYNRPNINSLAHDVTFEPWQTTATLSVNAYVDGGAESGTNTLTAEIRRADSGHQAGSLSTAEVEINDPPTGSTLITVSANPDFINEGSSTAVTLTRTGGDTTQKLALDWGCSNHTDSSWEAGECWLECTNAQCTEGPAEGTYYYEDGWIFSFSQELEEYYPGHFISIADDDDPQVTVNFEQSSYTVAEGATTTIKVILSGAPERRVTVYLSTANQHGASISDYEAPSNLTFESEEIEKSFVFSAGDDDVDDDGESVRLGFVSLPTGVAAGTITVVSITDDDAVGVPVDPTTLTVDEGGDPNDASYTVVLNSQPTADVTVTVTKPNGVSTDMGSLIFTPGNWDTSQRVKVWSNPDNNVEDETGTITHSVSGADYGSVSVSDVTVNVIDDDYAVSFELASYIVTEGGTTMIKVFLSDAPESAATIPLTTTDQGGATSTDYSGVPANVTFNSGETEKSFTFSATADDVDDDGEGVKIGFGTLPEGMFAGTTVRTIDETTVSITDDVLSVAVSFEQGPYTVAEGSTVTVKVKLSADPGRTVTIPLTKTDQGDASSADYSGVPAHVTFNSGSTSTFFSFSATDDNVDDDGESVKLTFGTLPMGVTAGTNTEAVISIADDDDPQVTVNFEQSSYTVAEGATTTIKVILSGAPERRVTVYLSTANQHGASISDYEAPSNLTFESEEIEKSFVFSAGDDDVDDDGESVRLGFVSLPTGVAAGTTTVVSITDDDAVGVPVDPTTLTVDEGGDPNDASYTVVLNSQPTADVTVTVTKPNGVSTDMGSLIFTPGNWDTSQRVKVWSNPDNNVEDETGTITHSVSGADYGSVSVSDVTVNVIDDDYAVSFELASYIVTEGGTTMIKVFLSDAPESAATIPLTTTDQGGATSTDYSGVPANVTFNSGETEKSFTFSATADDVDDDGEGVKIGFGTLPEGMFAGTTVRTIDETTVSITDDVLSVAVSFEQGPYTVAEGSTVTVKVKLSADPGRTVTIPLTKTDQGGASSADYSGVPAHVTFNSGSTSTFFSFSATDDNVDDDGESVKLTFGTLPTGVGAGTTNESTVNITDDDVPSVTVSFEQATYTVAEGSSITVKVKLDKDPERTVTIPISNTNQGGTTSADYSGVPAHVTFNSGSTSTFFSFSATDDNVDDDGESVKLTFGTLPTGVGAGTTNESTVNITDDDVPSVTVSFEQATYTVAEGSSITVKVKLDKDPERTVTIDQRRGPGEDSYHPTNESTVNITDDDVPSVTVSFEQATYTVAEGSSITVKVKLDKDPERTVTIPISNTNQGGTTSADYSGVPAHVTFNSGSTSTFFSFSATDDNVDDDGESVKLTFGTLPTGVGAGTTNESTVNITDDDVPSVTVSFEQATYTVAEGSSITVKVKLDKDPERTVTIPISNTNQGGTTSADYSGVPAHVTFNSGSTSTFFSFSATDDNVDDDGESVKLTFGTLPTGVGAGTTNESTVNITDDDVPSVTVSFEQATYTVAEGSSITVKVKLDKDPERTVTIPISNTNQGGTTSADYSGVPAHVTFNSGDTENSITFSAASDSVDDDGESVKLGFGTLPVGVSAGTTNEATISIDNSNSLRTLTVNFGAPAYGLSEGSTTTITVTLSAMPGSEVSIPLTKTNRGGASRSDYSWVPASVTFGGSDTEKTFTFSAAQDTIDDDGESVKIGFGTLPGGVSAGSISETTVSITDDDPQSSVTVNFGAASYSVTEGSTVDIQVTLSKDPEQSVAIPISKTNQGGTSSADYSGVPESVTFNSGETEKSFTFAATLDEDDENNEQVILAFGTLPAGVAAGSLRTATVELVNAEMESEGCGTAIWSATVTLGQYNPDDPNGGGTYHWRRPDARLVGDTYSTYEGTRYDVGNIYAVLSHVHPYLSRFVIKFKLFNPAEDEQIHRWTVSIDGVAFPFTRERLVGGGFRWRHRCSTTSGPAPLPSYGLKSSILYVVNPWPKTCCTRSVHPVHIASFR